MKILAINGSRRKMGNTSILLGAILNPLASVGLETEQVFLGDYRIEACTGCEACSQSWDCVIKDDFASLINKLDQADAVILGSPTYWYTVTSDMKRFIDRCYSLIQFPESRRQWISKYGGRGKVCVTAAVCEQNEEAMMGNTLNLLSNFSRDIGLDVISSIKALGHFSAGSIGHDQALLQQAGKVGKKLLQSLQPSAQDPIP